MGTGYTRNDTSNNIADGNIINASDLDGEFDAIESAMSTSGHTHDGTSAEGGPVTVVGPAQDLVVTASEVKPKTDNTLDLGTSSLQFKNAYFQGTVDTDGIMTAATFEPDGDTAAGDNAAIGYTAAEGLILTGQGSTSDITFKNDADTTVFSIPTGTDDVLFPDNAKAIFGTGSDLQIYHDGSNSIIADAGTGNIKIQANDFRVTNANASESIITADQDGAANLWYNGSKKLATTNTGIDVTGNATFADNGKAIFGAGSDLQIYHDGSHSYLYETGTGEFRIKTNGNIIQFLDNSNNYLIKATVGAEVGLYFNTAQKLATTNTGIDITGNATFADNGQAIFGAGSDLTILHNGSDSTITNATGTLTIQNTADDEDVDIVSDDGSGGTAVYFRADGSSGQAKLYHNNAGTGTLRLNTSSDGIDIVGHADIEGHFTATDGCTITTADNSTQLTLTSTDADSSEGPRLDLRRDSASPANGDLIGTIRYLGDDDGGTTTVFGEIQLEADAIADGSESGQMRLMIRNNGNLRNAVVIDATEVLFNQSNDDVDFRVESDTKTHALFVQGSDGNVGIGTGSPSSLFEVNKGSAGTLATFTDGVNSNFVVETASLITTVGNTGGSTALAFKSSNTERMRIDASGNVGIGTSSPSSRMQVSTAGTSTTTNTNVVARFVTNGSNADSHIQISNGVDHSANIGIAGGANLYFANDGTERMRIDSSGNVGIGTSSPQATAEISGGLDNRLRINSTDGTTSNNYGIDFSTAGTVRGGIRYNAGNNYLAFYGYDNTERMRINSSGNVGIGTSSPASELDVEGVIRLTNTSNSANYGTISDGGGLVINSQNNNPMYFYTGGSERMRIDSSGNLLVGKTSSSGTVAGAEMRSDGYTVVTRAGATPMQVRRLTDDGELVHFYNASTKLGSIGSINGSDIYIESGDGVLYIGGSGAGSLRAINAVGSGTPRFEPNFDNTTDLGFSSKRFDDIYATNGTIQTSDRNEKQDIEELTEAEQRVAVAAKGLLRKFRWKDAVAEKGDEARTHFGIIAQDLQAAFAAEGLDAGDYAMFISSTWTDEETGEERTRMGVRYSELLAFIIAAI